MSECVRDCVCECVRDCVCECVRDCVFKCVHAHACAQVDIVFLKSRVVHFDHILNQVIIFNFLHKRNCKPYSVVDA